MKVSLIILSLNEGSNLIRLIGEISDELNGKEFEVIVVEDGIDSNCLNSLDILKSYKNVHVIKRALPNGLAGATGYGLSRADGDILIVLDGDGTHDPINIQTLVEKASANCIAVASRFKPKWIVKNSFQHNASLIFNFFIAKYLKTGVNDNLGGFYALPKSAALDLLGENVFIGHGDYFIRLIIAARRLKFEIVEVPVIFRARYSGTPTKSRLWMVRKYMSTILEVKNLM